MLFVQQAGDYDLAWVSYMSLSTCGVVCLDLLKFFKNCESFLMCVLVFVAVCLGSK